ncbi:PAS domain S-box protein [Spirosoma agri]|uniref:histidine kinase n=1 Tax=Spirosoma agri TaxID=1987381 RepID=A0A6M0IN58_9BACT|nr:PAS domain S-box protein [Spirosoma agri]NEU68353.1 PAS domain S-box protein [Spirosoma agri]
MTDPDSPVDKINAARLERVTTAIQAAGIGIWEMNPIHKLVYLDDCSRVLFGGLPDGIISFEQLLTYIHLDERQKVRQAVELALTAPMGGSYEIAFRTINPETGQVRWLYSKGSAHFDRDGQPDRFLGTVQDRTPTGWAQTSRDRNETLMSEKMAEVALDNANAGYFRYSIPDDRLDYSLGFARVMTGLESHALAYQDFLDRIHPDDLLIRANAFNVAVQTGRLDYEVRIVWYDDTIHWMRARGNYLYDKSGNPYLLTGTVYDTTAEHLQREAEALLVAAFTNASVGMGFTELNGQFITVNSAFTELLGYTEEELYATTDRALTHPDDRPQHDEPIRELVAGKRQFVNLVKRYIHKDGTIRWADVNLTRITGSVDKQGRILETVRDISAEIDNQQLVATSGALFRNVTNSSPTGLWLSDEAGSLTYLNKTLVDWSGLPYESLLGAGWDNAIVEEDRLISAQIFQNAVAARAHYDVMFRLIKRDGSAMWCRAAGDPYYREDGSYAGYAGFCMDIDELVSGRSALQDSEAKFRSLIEEAPVATCLFVGRDLTIEVANEPMIEMWGKGNAVLGKPLAEAIPELEGQPFLAILDDVYTTGKTYTAQGMRADLVVNGVLGTYYFDYTYKPLCNAAGEVYAIMDMAVNVTEAVKARQELEESELFSRDIVETSPVAKVVCLGADMIIRTVNEKMQAMLGRDRSIIGMPIIDAVPELKSTLLLDRLRHVFSTGETFYQPEEKIDLIKFGRPYTGYYNYTYKALYNTAGERYGIMITATEVTDQVVARQKVEEAESSLRGAIELAELGTLQIDLKTGNLLYSDRLKYWLGLEKEEAITLRKGLRPIRKADRVIIRDYITKAVTQGKEGAFDVEYTVNATSTSRERILHAQGKAFFNEEGEAVKIIGTVQDITEQRKIQIALERLVQERTEELEATNEELAATNEELAATNEELAEANEELAKSNTGLAESNQLLTRSNQNLEQFAYIASHDLQEPLRKVQQFSSLLREQYAEVLGNSGNDLLHRMESAGSRMSMLIRDLLAFSRISTRQAQAVPVPLRHVVDYALENLAVTVEETNAQIRIAPLPTVQGDALQLGQLFQNLLANALKFSQKDRAGYRIMPQITIRAREIPTSDLPPSIKPSRQTLTYHRIEVADNGIGFDDKYVDRIFQVFQRLHNKNEYAGTGVGLAICQKVVMNHGGVITATSQPGEGATFTVYLPV